MPVPVAPVSLAPVRLAPSKWALWRFAELSLARGRPLLEGLKGDVCHSPHWGYIISGDLVATYADGSTENCVGGDVFYWPAGHSIRVNEDAEIILFSPQHEHLEVIGHIAKKLGVA